jgi:hypothetical protein
LCVQNILKAIGKVKKVRAQKTLATGRLGGAMVGIKGKGEREGQERAGKASKEGQIESEKRVKKGRESRKE